MAVETRLAETVPRAPSEPTTGRGWYAMVAAGGVLGVVSGVWQTVERIAYTAGGNEDAFCEINAVLSCNSVFSHWQSSALGIPNSLISMPVFAILAAGGLAGLMGSRLSRSFAASLLGLTVFMAVFLTWYMQQSAFDIGVLCIYCTVCAVGVVVVGIGITRVADATGALGAGAAGRRMRLLVEAGADIVIWLGLAALIALMLYLGLVL